MKLQLPIIDLSCQRFEVKKDGPKASKCCDPLWPSHPNSWHSRVKAQGPRRPSQRFTMRSMGKREALLDNFEALVPDHGFLVDVYTAFLHLFGGSCAKVLGKAMVQLEPSHLKRFFVIPGELSQTPGNLTYVEYLLINYLKIASSLYFQEVSEGWRVKLRTSSDASILSILQLCYKCLICL